MRCEIITIGDEILIGQIVDTNSAWMAVELNKVGVDVVQITSISDQKEHILKALNEASTRAELVLITGGLGPTKDDVTKVCLCEFLDCKLVFNEEQFAVVERIFKSFGRTVSEINRKQAEVPEASVCLVNSQGTAPGMWFEKNNTVYVSMPGVPYEMKHLMQSQVLPRIRERFAMPVILHRTFCTQGVGESLLASWIEDWENNLPGHIKLAYLPSTGMVRLRLSARGTDENQLNLELKNLGDSLYAQIGKHIYAEGEKTLPEVIQEMMIARKSSLGTAESCTGGAIAAMLTAIPGASAYFQGSTVTYSNALKMKVLGVSKSSLETYGAVSEAVVREMAEGLRKLYGVDYSISVSGVAGPDGGSEEKPVGTVWIGIGTPQGTFAKQFRFSTDRGRNIQMASLSALNYLRRILLGIED